MIVEYSRPFVTISAIPAVGQPGKDPVSFPGIAPAEKYITHTFP